MNAAFVVSPSVPFGAVFYAKKASSVCPSWLRLTYPMNHHLTNTQCFLNGETLRRNEPIDRHGLGRRKLKKKKKGDLLKSCKTTKSNKFPFNGFKYTRLALSEISVLDYMTSGWNSAEGKLRCTSEKRKMKRVLFGNHNNFGKIRVSHMSSSIQTINSWPQFTPSDYTANDPQ